MSLIEFFFKKGTNWYINLTGFDPRYNLCKKKKKKKYKALVLVAFYQN